MKEIYILFLKIKLHEIDQKYFDDIINLTRKGYRPSHDWESEEI